MPKRCSIPGCGIGYKKGLKLLCYPKNPERRAAWLQSLANAGVKPMHKQFICELHFGPNQWEKVRVDGTRKLKWKSVPDVLPLVLDSNSNCHETEIADMTGTDKLESSCDRSNGAASAHSPSKYCTQGAEKTAAGIFENGMQYPTPSVAKSGSKLSSLQIPARTINSLLHSCLQQSTKPKSFHSYSAQPTKLKPLQPYSAKDCVQKSFIETEIPFERGGHSVVIRMPASQSSLMEDLNDVRSFLNETDHAYEKKLVKAVVELVKKHQLLDEKLKKAENVLAENVSLKNQLLHQNKILAENLILKEKLSLYEGSATSLIMSQARAGSEESVGTRNDCDVKRIGPNVAFINSNKISFVSLDDQL